MAGAEVVVQQGAVELELLSETTTLKRKNMPGLRAKGTARVIVRATTKVRATARFRATARATAKATARAIARAGAKALNANMSCNEPFMEVHVNSATRPLRISCMYFSVHGVCEQYVEDV